ncbi:MAG: TetR/AcrR family transcriptional regulator [bacterium]|jgi:AcrR family transcriptional regulator|nr:TetR/AcrR family transcriptional regulator [bacterium]
MSDVIKEQVVNEAKKLFFVYGFKKVSMDEIAAACKMSKKTIYQLYSSKDELIRECVSRITTAKVSEIHKILDSSPLICGGLKGMFEIFSSINQDVSEAMMRDMSYFPDIWNMIEEKRMTVFARMGDIIEQGKIDGSIQPELNVDLFLRIFMGILQRFANPAMFAELNLRPSEFIEQMKMVVFEGILTVKARRQ